MGEEAFHNAKSRFYAKMHGLLGDIQVPDPNLYTDEIDWDCVTDPELILDLDCKPGNPDTAKKGENIVIFGDTLLRDKGFSSTGWGGCEDKLKEAPNSSDEKTDNPWKRIYRQNNGHVEGSGWENSGNNSWGWYYNNGTAMVGYGWGDGWGNSGWEDGWGNCGWEDSWNYSWGWYQYGNSYPVGSMGRGISTMGTQKTLLITCHGMEPRGFMTMTIRGISRGGMQIVQANRVKFVSESPMKDKGTGSKGKLTNSCAPVNHRASRKNGNRWSMEKPVLLKGCGKAM